MVRKEAITKPVTCCWSCKVRKHPQQGGSLLSQQQNRVGILNLAPRFELPYYIIIMMMMIIKVIVIIIIITVIIIG